MSERWPLGKRSSTILVAVLLIVLVATAVLTLIQGFGSAWSILVFGLLFIFILVRRLLATRGESEK
jgi:1,4-dihydroxy-2-naphthoate octaprenyltransferase